MLGRMSMITAAAVLAGAGTAGAAAYVPYGGLTSKSRAVVLRVAANGKKIVLARTGLDIACTDNTSDLISDGWSNVAISRTGRFAATFADEPGTASDGKPTLASGSIAGRLNARTRKITGTWTYSIKTTQPDGSTVTCDTGTVKFSAAGPARKRTVGGTYGTFAANSYPVLLRVNAKGTQIPLAKGLLELTCDNGGHRTVSDSWTKLGLTNSGRFSASVTDQDATYIDGTPYKVTSLLSGTVSPSGRRAAGTWRVVFKTPQADGSTETCDSGVVKFSVKR